jgi:hypothetical protein
MLYKKRFPATLYIGQGLIRLWRSEGLATFDRVIDSDTSGNPPLLGTRNWILPGPPPDGGGSGGFSGCN